MRVPGLVVAEVDLHQVDSCLDQLARGQERPAEGVLSIVFELPGIGIVDIKGSPGVRITQQPQGELVVAPELADRFCPAQSLLLGVDRLEYFDSPLQACPREILGERQLGNVEVVIRAFLESLS